MTRDANARTQSGHGRWQILLVAAVIAITAIAGMTTATARTPATSGVYLGVYQHGAPWDMTRLAEFERDAGKKAAIVMWYQVSVQPPRAGGGAAADGVG